MTAIRGRSKKTKDNKSGKGTYLEEAGHVGAFEEVVNGVEEDIERSRGAGREARPLPAVVLATREVRGQSENSEN